MNITEGDSTQSISQSASDIDNVSYKSTPSIHSGSILSILDCDQSLPSHVVARQRQQIRFRLGRGPLRFEPAERERSIEAQMDELTDSERKCVQTLREKWDKLHPDIFWTDAVFLRFARCSPGKPFQLGTALKVLKNFNLRFSKLTIKRVETQLLCKAIFPIPGLKSKEGLEMLYVRPSRILQYHLSAKEVVENLVYCLNVMFERESCCRRGVGIIITMGNLSELESTRESAIEASLQFLQVLEHIPVRIELLLFVNAPSSFSKKQFPKLQRKFSGCCKQIVNVSSTDLSTYLQTDFDRFLPDDDESALTGGFVNAEQLVRDYIIYRKYLEAAVIRCSKRSSQQRGSIKNPIVDATPSEVSIPGRRQRVSITSLLSRKQGSFHGAQTSRS